MNQIILEIADKAHKQAYAVYTKRMETEFPGDVIFHDIYNSLFAEMIVQECSKVIVNGGYRNPALGEKHPLTPPEIATMIREHFGVEE